MTAVDLKALRDEALAGEDGETYRQGIPMMFEGIEFRVPPLRLWPMRVMRAQRTEGVDVALELLLGAEVADALIDAGFVLDDLDRLAKASAPEGSVPPTRLSSASGR